MRSEHNSCLTYQSLEKLLTDPSSMTPHMFDHLNYCPECWRNYERWKKIATRFTTKELKQILFLVSTDPITNAKVNTVN